MLARFSIRGISEIGHNNNASLVIKLDPGNVPCVVLRHTLFSLMTIQLWFQRGWLLVSNVMIDSSSPTSQLPVESSYRGISRSQMVLQKSANNDLRTHLTFSQMRFHCKKKRTFHVTTARNNAGEAVVQYFSGQTDTMLASCGSYVKMREATLWLLECAIGGARVIPENGASE